MIATEATTIPLSQAYYCPSCNAIQPDPRRCVTCGEANVYPVSRWLDRESKGESNG